MAATQTLRIQNTYDRVPCSPPDIIPGCVYQHVGAAYLIAFYNTDWVTPYALLYNHQALNYQAVLACAFTSHGGVCLNDNLPVPSDGETLVSIQPDPSTLCSLFFQTQASGTPAVVSPVEPGSDSPAVVPNSGL